jgi:hypothetical protein
MPMIAEYFIEELRVLFYMILDLMRNVKINEIIMFFSDGVFEGVLNRVLFSQMIFLYGVSPGCHLQVLCFQMMFFSKYFSNVLLYFLILLLNFQRK